MTQSEELKKSILKLQHASVAMQGKARLNTED